MNSAFAIQAVGFVAGSYAGMFVEIFLFVSNLIGQYRFDMRRKHNTRQIARKAA